MTDAIIQRIERFAFPQGGVCAERRHRGYTLTHAATGAPVARLRQNARVAAQVARAIAELK